MSEKHLTTGDAYPNLPDDGKLVLLSMRFCPYAQRAHLVLDAKQIPYHTINIHLKQKPEWLTQYSRLGKVPALGLTNEPGQPYIHESLIIADYLDERYATVRPLHQTAPLAKTLDRLWVQRFDGIISLYYRIVLATNEAASPGALIEELSAGLDAFEAEIALRGTRFFAGDVQPGMLDYMIWPWFERLTAMQWLEGGKRFVWAPSRFGRLLKYHQEMVQDEVVKKTFVSAENHYKYILSSIAGKPDYEMLSSL